MSQFDWGTMDPYVVDGVQLADLLNKWRDAVYTLHRGAVRPTYVVPGMAWVDDSAGPTNWIVKWYISPALGDTSVWRINTTTGLVTLLIGTGADLTAAHLIAETTVNPSVRWNATTNPIDAKAWRATDTATGALRFGVYTDAGVETQWIQFNRDGTVTSSAVVLNPLPACRFEPSANWVWGATSYIRIGLNTTVYNFGGGVLNAATGVWTPGAAGLWHIEARVYWGNASGLNSQVSIEIRKNGAFWIAQPNFSASGIASMPVLTEQLQLIATDTIEMGASISVGGTFNFSSGPHTSLQAHRIR